MLLPLFETRLSATFGPLLLAFHARHRPALGALHLALFEARLSATFGALLLPFHARHRLAFNAVRALDVLAATAAAFGSGGLAATTIPVRLCASRGRDRQRGYAGCEDHPIQHDKSPSERQERPVSRAVPTGCRVDLAGYRTRVNLKCPVRSGTYSPYTS
ncbi:hypothetical protein GCM10023325_02410 [Sphingomonas lutea]